MPKVSVLVAVYNAEKYLRACLDSLLNQSLKDIEIVCVDDASTDNSLPLLNEYAAKDSRLKVATLAKNSGISHTRNVALGMSTGEYVCMVDSDDWLSADALQLSADVLDNEQGVDCVLFDFIVAERDDVQGTYTRQRRYNSMAFSRISGLRACELSLDWRIHGLYICNIPTTRAVLCIATKTPRACIIGHRERWRNVRESISIDNMLCRQRMRLT